MWKAWLLKRSDMMIKILNTLLLLFLFAGCEKKESIEVEKMIDIMTLTPEQRLEKAQNVIIEYSKNYYPIYYNPFSWSELIESKTPNNGTTYWDITHEYVVKKKEDHTKYLIKRKYSLDKSITKVAGFTHQGEYIL